MTIRELYEHEVKRLSVAERIQLVRLIVDDLAESAQLWAVDENDAWSEEDLRDLTHASLLYGSKALLDEAENDKAG